MKESPIWKTKISKLKEKEYGQQKICSLKQNGVPLEYEISRAILEIQLTQPILKKDSSTFAMQWEAKIRTFIRKVDRTRTNSEGITLSMTQWCPPKAAAYDYEDWNANEIHQ